MNVQLIIVSGPGTGRSFPLTEGELMLVGRDGVCAVQLLDPSVSRIHCRILVTGATATITDADSSYGVFVNNSQVSRQTLQFGDEIVVGGTQMRLEAVTSAQASTVPPPRTRGVTSVLDVNVKQSDTDPPEPDAGDGTDSAGIGERTVMPPVRKPPAPAQPALAYADMLGLVGQTLWRYEIQEVICRARTGMLFRALDTRRDRLVALKILWPEFARQPDEVARIVRSMKTMMDIRHPHLIRLYRAANLDGYCFTASEFVEGESCAQMIHRIGIGGMLEWQVAFRVAMHVTRALDFAHDKNIVHRNITPTNILVRSADGVVKLGDLMLAKAVAGTQVEQITQPGELVGDLVFLSPEQTMSGQAVDGRTDIYNLGATVYALLTGHPPFEGDSPADIIGKIQSATPVSPREHHMSIPPLFEGVVLRMLAKRPDDRFPNSLKLLQQLCRVARYQGITDI